MPANLEDSAVATGLENGSFHSNPKDKQCQRTFKLPHNCTHFPTLNQPVVSRKVLTRFLSCIQVSQEAGIVIWYSHLFKNSPQFVVIHTVKGFSLVTEAKVDVFLEPSCIFDDPADVGNLISGSSAFSRFSLYVWKFFVHVLLKPSLKNFELYLVSI